MKQKVRVRFAPSPTGFMHLGNVRTALLNYLFAQQKKGLFVLRIEDTDAERNREEAYERIIQDLSWLSLSYHEGPGKGGLFGPYLQSQRTSIYQEKLQELIDLGRAYRCFCKPEQLEEQRQKQLAAGLPPRYDRTCLQYSSDKIKRKVEAGIPFIWRFRINQDQILTIKTPQDSTIDFDMKHFSDFALSRSDGSFTFIFVNFVDDWLMEISHVIRGQDHLSNTALQAALYDAFAIPLPFFWHLAIICNAQGEKLSKRDFGFSLNDLRSAGFIPEAIINYLALMGTTATEEVQSAQSLAQSINFEKFVTHGTVKYDLEKLTWFNHQWIKRLSAEDFKTRLAVFCKEQYNQTLPDENPGFNRLLVIVQQEQPTLKACAQAITFYREEPVLHHHELVQSMSTEVLADMKKVIKHALTAATTTEELLSYLKTESKTHQLKAKDFFMALRYALTGSMHGLQINDLFVILDLPTLKHRLTKLLLV